MGYATPSSGGTRGVYGRSDSPDGDGIQARNGGGSGAGAAMRAFGGNNTGFVGSTDAADRMAVHATHATADGVAVLAENTSGGGTSAGVGVRGLVGGGTVNDLHPGGTWEDGAGEFAGPNGVIGAATGAGNGVIGIAPNGTGVRATSVFSTGVDATSAQGIGISGTSDSGYGIYGKSNSNLAGYFDGRVRCATSDATQPALRATHATPDGVAILAENTSGGSGANEGSGIRALSGGATVTDIHPYIAPLGEAAGEFAGRIGVIGVTHIKDGSAAYGVVGASDAWIGVHGFSNTNIGVFALSISGTGVFGSSVSGIAGFFQGPMGTTSYLEFQEVLGAPSAAPANSARLFARDNGSAKTQLCVRFPSGAVQVLATEP